MFGARFDRRWVVFAFCIAYAAFTVGVITTGFSFWVGPWIQDFKVPAAAVMTVWTAANLMLVLIGPLVGRSLDFISVRAAVTGGSLLIAIGLVLTTLIHQYWLLLAIFGVVVPVGGCFVGILPATVLGVRMFPERAGMINGLIALSMSLSGVIIAVLATALIGPYGWRGVFLVAAAVYVLLIAPVAWLLLNVEEGAATKTLDAGEHGHAPPAGSLDALKQPVFWVLVCATLPVMGVVTSMAASIAAILGSFGIERAGAALLASTYMIASAVGAVGGGWLADRLPPRLFYAGIIGAQALALLILSQHPTLYLIAAALVAFGFSSGCLMPWSGAVVMQRFGARAFGRVYGLLMAFYAIPMIAPILFGWIHDRTGSYQASFLAFLVVLAPGLVTLVLLRPAEPEVVLAPAE